MLQGPYLDICHTDPSLPFTRAVLLVKRCPYPDSHLHSQLLLTCAHFPRYMCMLHVVSQHYKHPILAQEVSFHEEKTTTIICDEPEEKIMSCCLTHPLANQGTC